MEKKLLFFDIDGTLVGFDSKMPESTMDALHKARANGHEIFIASGRSVCQIYPFLNDFGFDGQICAAGAYVSYHGEVISHQTFGQRRMKWLMKFFSDNDTKFYIQTKDFSVLPKKQLGSFVRTMRPEHASASDEAMLAGLQQLLGDVRLDDELSDYDTKYDTTETIVYFDCPYTVNELRRILGPMGMKVTKSSFREPTDYMGEITLVGLNKSNGIKVICDHLGMDVKDSIAFGDGPNDLDMIDFAGCSVCMANGVDEVKERADYITDAVDHDGIYKAMEHLHLL